MAKKAKATKLARKTVRTAAKTKPRVKRVEAIPSNMAQLTPYFWVSNAKAAVDFYKQVFGAKVMSQMLGPDGSLAHCSLKIGSAVLNLSEPFGPAAKGSAGRSSGVMLYVRDARATFAKAVELGARVIMPVADMMWGDRWGCLEDPFGNVWQISTHVENVSPKEIARRMATMIAVPDVVSKPPPGPNEMMSQILLARA